MADSAAAIAMKRKGIDLVIAGADRVASNADTANKIGTYALAILAAHHGIPFYIAALARRSTSRSGAATKSPSRTQRRRGQLICRHSRRAGRRGRLQSGVRRYTGASHYRVRDRMRHHPVAVRRVDTRPRISSSRTGLPSLKFYEFLDKQPAIGKLVIVEGTERALAERAMDVLLDRLLPAEVRDLNLARFGPDDLGDMAHLREAVRAMPFPRGPARSRRERGANAARRSATRAVCGDGRCAGGKHARRERLLSPRSARPQSLGSLAGRAALRIDTTADEQTRARFVAETLERLHATAEPRPPSPSSREARRI